jgi:hypothetical protein
MKRSHKRFSAAFIAALAVLAAGCSNPSTVLSNLNNSINALFK